MKYIVWGTIVLLAIVHQHFWFWEDDWLVFGFMPIGLFYQALIALGAGATWALVIKYCWPTRVEEWAVGEPADRREQDRA